MAGTISPKARRAVLKKLQAARRPRSPRDLINELQRERLVSEAAARHLIWRLLDLGEIQLTWDRKLELARNEHRRDKRSAVATVADRS